MGEICRGLAFQGLVWVLRGFGAHGSTSFGNFGLRFEKVVGLRIYWEIPGFWNYRIMGLRVRARIIPTPYTLIPKQGVVARKS